ncbi:MAG: hypothetical protein U5S82_10075 [Gammaproteobacteria bacterium]|nr:hypothetical protein [Gammaproteobacteria bacterium]
MEQALLDPASVFASPEAVVADDTLSRDQKVQVLRRWEYDARELEVAEEENMGGGPPDILGEVLDALSRLGVGFSGGRQSPTKQGGT